MNYSIDEYRKAFPIKGKVMSRQTIRRKIDNNQLPITHKAIRHGLQWVIEVNPSNSQIADKIADCCCEYRKIWSCKISSTQERIDSAIELALKYELKPATILRVLGL